jgi:hypothetical protein
MKPYKLLACLVTLQITGAFTLKAATGQKFREWTDDKGRQISACLVDMPDATTVKIEREDGRVFITNLKTFSAADQAYALSYLASKKAAAQPKPADDTPAPDAKALLVDADAATWTLLNTGGNQPGSVYTNTGLDTIIALINERLAAKGLKTLNGVPLQIRTEPASLAGRVKISGEVPRMTVAAFVKHVAQINKMAVKTDSEGMIVLTELASENVPSPSNFFGVPVEPK